MNFWELKSEEHVLNLVFCLNYFDYSQLVSWWVSGPWVGEYMVSSRWVGGPIVGGSVVGGFNKTRLFTPAVLSKKYLGGIFNQFKHFVNHNNYVNETLHRYLILIFGVKCLLYS